MGFTTSAIRPFFIAGILLSSIFLIGCSSGRLVELPGSLDYSSCAAENDQLLYLRNKPLFDSVEDAAPFLAPYFSPASLKVAQIIGANHLLNQYWKNLEQFQQQPSLSNRLLVLELRQQISFLLNLASLEVLSVGAVLDCEQERSAQVAEYVKGKESSREKKLTVGAIVVTGTSAILTGILINKDKAADKIGIAGGLIGTGLGVAVFTGNKRVEFVHPENPLGDIWYAPASSTFFPKVIWKYLNYSYGDSAKHASLRHRVINSWQSLGHLPMPNETDELDKAVKLFFGVKGIYTSSELQVRASMLDQLEAAISLMNQDINVLAREIEAMRASKFEMAKPTEKQ